MTIASALEALNTDIQNARTAITNKGGTVTTNGGSSQLATDIATIPSSDTSDIEEALHNINSGGTTKDIAWVSAINAVILNDDESWGYTFSSNITDEEAIYQLVNNFYNSIGTLKITSEGEYYFKETNAQITPFMKVNHRIDASQTYEVSQWTVVNTGGIVYTSKNPIIGTGFWGTYNNSTLSDFATGYYYYTDGQKHYAKSISSGDLMEITKVGD